MKEEASKLVLNDDDSNSEAISEAAASGKKYDVTLAGRTFSKDGEWNSICLPFDVVLEGSPLEGATAKTLTSATMDETQVTLTFGEAVTTLSAGVPYIIKWEATDEQIVEPTFSKVTVVNSSDEERTISLADDNVQFAGYYDAFSITPGNGNIYYITAGNKLIHSSMNHTLKAFRAYFRLSEEAVTHQFVLDFGDGDSTSIMDQKEETNDKYANAGWYTLDGRKLNGKPTKKGIYLHNGRAVMK